MPNATERKTKNRKRAVIPVPVIDNKINDFKSGTKQMFNHIRHSDNPSLQMIKMSLGEQVRFIEELHPHVESEQQKETIQILHSSLRELIDNVSFSSNKSVTWSFAFHDTDATSIRETNKYSGVIEVRLWDGVYNNDSYVIPIEIRSNDDTKLYQNKRFATADMVAAIDKFELGSHCTFSLTTDKSKTKYDGTGVELSMATGSVTTGDVNKYPDVPSTLPAVKRLKED